MICIGVAMWACGLIMVRADQYDADNHVTVYFVSSETARDHCNMLIGQPHDACAASQVMILPNPCLYFGDPYACMACHELHHVNGDTRERIVC